MMHVRSISMILAALMTGPALAGEEATGKAGGNQPALADHRPVGRDTSLRYVYEYKLTDSVTPGSWKEDCGLPESYADRVRGDSRVEAICIEGNVLVVCDKGQLYMQRTVSKATGLMLGGGAKDASYRVPARTEEWFFGDGTVARATTGGPAGFPEGELLLIDQVSSADDMLTCLVLPPDLASRFGLESSMPSGSKDVLGVRDGSIHCDDVIKVDKETSIEGAIAYEVSLPLSSVIEGNASEGSRWYSDVVLDAASELPIRITSGILPAAEGLGRPSSTTAAPAATTAIPKFHSEFEWTEVGGMKLAQSCLSVTGSPELIEAARSGQLAEEGSLPPPTTIILRLKSALAGEAALREGGVPVLPDTKEIQDNTVSPPRTIK